MFNEYLIASELIMEMTLQVENSWVSVEVPDRKLFEFQDAIVRGFFLFDTFRFSAF